MSIAHRLDRLEDGLKSHKPPRVWEFPFGTFNTLAEALESEDGGHYIEQQRQEILEKHCPQFHNQTEGETDE